MISYLTITHIHPAAYSCTSTHPPLDSSTSFAHHHLPLPPKNTKQNNRSNVGKSSLLNMVCNRKDLAYVSKRPGKTQQFNYFLVNDK